MQKDLINLRKIFSENLLELDLCNKNFFVIVKKNEP